MSERNEEIDYVVACALDDARLFLTRAYAANDPEMREVVNVAVDAVFAYLIEDAEEQNRRTLLLCEGVHVPPQFMGVPWGQTEEPLADWLRKIKTGQTTWRHEQVAAATRARAEEAT